MKLSLLKIFSLKFLMTVLIMTLKVNSGSNANCVNHVIVSNCKNCCSMVFHKIFNSQHCQFHNNFSQYCKKEVCSFLTSQSQKALCEFVSQYFSLYFLSGAQSNCSKFLSQYFSLYLLCVCIKTFHKLLVEGYLSS